MLRGPAGALEGLLQQHDGAPVRLAALVCHPHPLYGGTLHNKVVHRAASTLHALGATVLRFDFRGVGKSQGTFDRGEGELEDARAALQWLESQFPNARLWACGFSFGAWVAARLAASESVVERVVLIAPPVRSNSFEVLRTAGVPKLVIQGTDDDVCPLVELEPEYRTWAEPKQLVQVAHASHFFDRRLGELGETLRHELEPLAPPT